MRKALLATCLALMATRAAAEGRESASYEVCAWTSKASHADTSDTVNVKLQSSDGVWSEQTQSLFTSTSKRQKKCTYVKLGSWPTAVKFDILGGNAWGFWKVTIDDCPVVEHPKEEEGQSYGDNGWWIDGNQDAPDTLTLDVPNCLCAHTSKASNADTKDRVKAKVQSGGSWSSRTTIFKGAKKGKHYCVAMPQTDFPTALKLDIGGSNAWGFWKIVYDGCVLKESSKGRSGNSYGNNGWWLDGNQAAPEDMTIDIPWPDSSCTFPTSSPTSTPTEAPTLEPTKTPTLEPTHLPTAHSCDDGSHGCDTASTHCISSLDHEYTCECLEGFVSAGSDTSCSATTAPTLEPTETPTVEPTEEPTLVPTEEPTEEDDDDYGSGSGSGSGSGDDDHDTTTEYDDESDLDHLPAIGDTMTPVDEESGLPAIGGDTTSSSSAEALRGGVVELGGAGYIVGDHLTLGAGVDGWDTPASLIVTAVNDDGGIVSVDIEDGGSFTGTDMTGTYNLDNAQATLLMKAQQPQQSRSKQARRPSQEATAAVAGIAVVAVAAAALSVYARKAKPQVAGPASEVATAITPSADLL